MQAVETLIATGSRFGEQGIGETARNPLKGITPGQLRALAAIAQRRGRDRPQLRDIAGVRESLRELSVVDASKLIDRLQTEDHRSVYTPPPPDRAARGAIKLASERQRNYIQSLVENLGWNGDKARHWLAERHEIRDLSGGTFSSKTAGRAITQLLEAIRARATKGAAS